MFPRTFVQFFLLVSLLGQLSAAPINQKHAQIHPRAPIIIDDEKASLSDHGGNAVAGSSALPHSAGDDGGVGVVNERNEGVRAHAKSLASHIAKKVKDKVGHKEDFDHSVGVVGPVGFAGGIPAAGHIPGLNPDGTQGGVTYGGGQGNAGFPRTVKSVAHKTTAKISQTASKLGGFLSGKPRPPQ